MCISENLALWELDASPFQSKLGSQLLGCMNQPVALVPFVFPSCRDFETRSMDAADVAVVCSELLVPHTVHGGAVPLALS